MKTARNLLKGDGEAALMQQEFCKKGHYHYLKLNKPDLPFWVDPAYLVLMSIQTKHRKVQENLLTNTEKAV